MQGREKPWRLRGALLTLWSIALLSCIGTTAIADQRVGAGGLVSDGNATFDLACTDLIVGGTLNVNQANYFNVRNVEIQSGGTLNGGSGTINFSGSFQVDPGSSYNPESLLVQRDDACAIPGSNAAPIPALSDAMLIALAGLLLWCASLVLGKKGVLRHESQSKGAGK